MPNVDFDRNIETLKYLGYVTHNAGNELTETARTVCARLSADNIYLSEFGVMCGAFAGKYWNEAKRDATATLDSTIAENASRVVQCPKCEKFTTYVTGCPCGTIPQLER